MARRAKSESQEERAVVATTGDHLVDLTVNLVSSYVGRNQVPLQDVPGLIKMFHGALAQAAGMGAQAAAEIDRKHAVPVKKYVIDE